MTVTDSTTSDVKSHLEAFFKSETFADTLTAFENWSESTGKPTHLETTLETYQRLKEASCTLMYSYKHLWESLDKKLAEADYTNAHKVSDKSMLVVGGGPAGLRMAIEGSLLGCRRVVVVEKRDTFSRYNILHLWPFNVTDMKSLGAKAVYPRFAVGELLNVSIRRLQLILLKIALVLGVQVCPGVEYVHSQQREGDRQWVPVLEPPQPALKDFTFNILIGAAGENSPVITEFGFKRKDVQFGNAIGITANFEITSHHNLPIDVKGGLISYANREFFDSLKEKGIDLENLVYYFDETHYIATTAKKHSLLEFQVLKEDLPTLDECLRPSNVNQDKLQDYAREVATATGIPTECPFMSLKPNTEPTEELEGAATVSDNADVAIFDFSKKSAAEVPSLLMADTPDTPLLVCLVGDSLIEPFWPQGTGMAHAALSALDVSNLISKLGNLKDWSKNSEDLLKQHVEAYKLLETSTAEKVADKEGYTLDPSTRYQPIHMTMVSM